MRPTYLNEDASAFDSPDYQRKRKLNKTTEAVKKQIWAGPIFPDR